MRLALAVLLAAVLAAEDAAPLREELLAAGAKLEGHAAWQLGDLRKALPAGQRLRLRWGQVYDMSKNENRPLLAEVVAVDDAGRTQGEERFYRAWIGSPVRTRMWKDGVLDGPERHFDTLPEGGKQYCRQEITWVAGVQDGVTRGYHANGKPMTETPYVRGAVDGLVRSWDDQGRLVREAPMRAGRRHGTVTEYWPETGKAKRIALYADGRVAGLVRDFYQDGAAKAETPYRNDARHGVEREFNPDGSVARTRWWIDGDAATAEAWAAAEKTPAKP